MSIFAKRTVMLSAVLLGLTLAGFPAFFCRAHRSPGLYLWHIRRTDCVRRTDMGPDCAAMPLLRRAIAAAGMVRPLLPQMW